MKRTVLSFIRKNYHVLHRSFTFSPPLFCRSKKTGFVDYVSVMASGGNGGDGAVMFTSEFMREFCGPDGGTGGNGAHVVLRCDNNVHSLSGIPSVIRGRAGLPGRAKGCTGKSAEHVFVDVPVGTVVYEIDEIASTRTVMADLCEEGDFLVVARGGAGGRGNQAFLTNEQRAPAFGEKGGRGERRKIAVEMKLIADVGLIGMPNAGKSSLLRALSRARPKVAAYPFTTLRPHIGVIDLPGKDRQVSIADLPGIIEGAHENRGLGLSFLRHIERCRALLIVVDVASTTVTAVDQFDILRSELDSHMPNLLKQRSTAVIGNKIDLLPTESNALSNLAKYGSCFDFDVIGVSAKFGNNVDSLEKLIFKMCS